MGVRYPQGGGLTAEQRGFREQVRLSAIDFFETGDDNKAVAKALRVSVRSIERWRAAWEAEGEQGLYSKVPASVPKLSPAQFQDELAGTVRFALKRIQYRPELVDGCLTETGLAIHPP